MLACVGQTYKIQGFCHRRSDIISSSFDVIDQVDHITLYHHEMSGSLGVKTAIDWVTWTCVQIRFSYMHHKNVELSSESKVMMLWLISARSELLGWGNIQWWQVLTIRGISQHSYSHPCWPSCTDTKRIQEYPIHILARYTKHVTVWRRIICIWSCTSCWRR